MKYVFSAHPGSQEGIHAASARCLFRRPAGSRPFLRKGSRKRRSWPGMLSFAVRRRLSLHGVRIVSAIRIGVPLELTEDALRAAARRIDNAPGRFFSRRTFHDFTVRFGTVLLPMTVPRC